MNTDRNTEEQSGGAGTERVPTARIEQRTSVLFGDSVTQWEVLDALGSWGLYATYAAAADRLKVRRSVEKAMRTRRANKARRSA